MNTHCLLGRVRATARTRLREVDSREICFAGLSQALADVGVVLNSQSYWPRHAIASPDLLLIWEQEFGPLPEAVDEIIVRCRTYVMAAAPRLIVIDEYARIAKAARAGGQRFAIGSKHRGRRAGRHGAGFSVRRGGHLERRACAPQPAPDIFLLAARRLAVSPRRCLVYEDTDAGVTAELAAGMTAYHAGTRHLAVP